MVALKESNLHCYIEEGQVDDYKGYFGQLFEYSMASWYMVTHDYDDESRRASGKRLTRQVFTSPHNGCDTIANQHHTKQLPARDSSCL